MLLYQKFNGQITPITIQAILSGKPRSYVLFDAKSSTHFFYQIVHEGDEEQLFRFPIRILKGSYFAFPMYQRFDSVQGVFLTTPYRKHVDYSFANHEAMFLTEEEQAEIKDALKKGHIPENVSKEVWYIKDSLLSEEQQRLLCFGSIGQLSTQSFFDYMSSLKLNVLEACIRSGIIDDLKLSEEDNTEIRAFRYFYLNPVEINKISLPFIEALHPTLGMIHDYTVQVIKNYILSKAPERESRLHDLHKLKAAHSITLGEKSPEFKEEGTYNPHGFTPKEDRLFQALTLIISAQANGIEETILSLLFHDDFESNSSQLNLLELLDDVIQTKLYQQTTQRIHNIRLITALDTIYPGLKCGNRLIFACDKILSTSEELLDCFFNQKSLPIECHKVIKSSQTPYIIIQALISLQQANISTLENRKAMLKHWQCRLVAEVVASLQHSNILNQENFEEVIKHQQTDLLAKVQTSLQQARILNQENFKSLIKNQQIDLLMKALPSLQQANILNQENFEVVLTHLRSELAETLTLLEQANILTQNNFEAVVKHQFLCWFPKALTELQQANILTQDNFEIVIKHRSPIEVVTALIALYQANILTHKNIETVVKHQFPYDVVDVLTLLKQANILTQYNLEIAFKHPHLAFVRLALKTLSKSKMLTSENFEIVIKHLNAPSVAEALVSLKHKNALDDVQKVIAAVKALQLYILNLPNKPQNWEKKAAVLYGFAINQMLLLGPIDPKEKAKFLARKVVNKAETLWGLDHQAGRIVLDVLLILLSFVAVGLIMIGAKKSMTGHGFFFFGKQEERNVLGKFITPLTH